MATDPPKKTPQQIAAEKAEEERCASYLLATTRDDLPEHYFMRAGSRIVAVRGSTINGSPKKVYSVYANKRDEPTEFTEIFDGNQDELPIKLKPIIAAYEKHVAEKPQPEGGLEKSIKTRPKTPPGTMTVEKP